MIRFFKFRQELFAPAPARDIYHKPGPGKGWPEECPPIRAANGYGYDLLSNFDLTFIRNRDGSWRVEPDVVLSSDFDWTPDQSTPGRPLTQQAAWFWQKGQVLPHPISDHVYQAIKNQAKLSSFLYLQTDPNEMLLVGDVPNFRRDFRALSALIETDWYPASYPWHVVIELDASKRRVTLGKGEPICRIIPVRRDTFFAQPMTPEQFDDFFARGQRWLTAHGRPSEHGQQSHTLDITKTYSKQQARSRFVVMD